MKPRVRIPPRVRGPERSRHETAGAAPTCEATCLCILDRARRAVESKDISRVTVVSPATLSSNSAGHEVIHVMATLRGSSVGIVLQQFDIKPVQAAGGPDIE